MISTLLKESKKKKNAMTSQAFDILPQSSSVSWPSTIKAIKTIRGSLVAAFELKIVLECSVVLKS